MCSNCGIPAQLESDQAFAERMMNMMNEASLALMTSIGHRTGLFDTMADQASSTARQIADRAGLNERYVREWLGAMTTGRLVEHDAAAGTYRLPADHAAWLTRAASPNNIAAPMQFFAVLAGVESKIVDCFRHGGGVPYDRYDRFNEVMAEESAQTVVAVIADHVVPMLGDAMIDRLRAGAEVLDVGCGSGRALVELASLFPNSRFTGYDLLPDAIAAAQRHAAQRGVSNATFAVRDVAEPFGNEQFDLITTFDAVHDQARPDLVLANIHAALKPDGLYLMQDIAMQTPHGDNLDHPLGPFIYTISCLHCMSVSLAQGGMGLGAAWGRQMAVDMLNAAGFADVAVVQLDHDVQNFWYTMRKAPTARSAAA